MFTTSRQSSRNSVLVSETEVKRWYQAKNHKCTAIFVHGLNGGPESTWCDGNNNNEFWPNWLNTEFPDLSIYSVGYPSTYVATNNSQTLYAEVNAILTAAEANNDAIAEKPIIIFCHSLGGIIAKKLLIELSAAASGFRQKLYQNVKMIVFIATPHDGAKIAKIFSHNAVNLPLSNYSKALGGVGTDITEIRSKFITLCANNTDIITAAYHETKPMSRWLHKTIVVDEHSAHPGTGCTPIKIDRNHIKICKPKNTSDNVYKLLSADVRRFWERFDSASIVKNHFELQKLEKRFIPREDLFAFRDLFSADIQLEKFFGDNNVPSEIDDLITRNLSISMTSDGALRHWTIESGSKTFRAKMLIKRVLVELKPTNSIRISNIIAATTDVDEKGTVIISRGAAGGEGRGHLWNVVDGSQGDSWKLEQQIFCTLSGNFNGDGKVLVSAPVDTLDITYQGKARTSKGAALPRQESKIRNKIVGILLARSLKVGLPSQTGEIVLREVNLAPESYL